MNSIAPLKQAVKSAIRGIVRWNVPHVECIILRKIPHDPLVFTQGLAYQQGMLYESSGDIRRSTVRCLSADNGALQRSVSIANDFAEGIAICGDQLYVLSWKSEKARVFLLPELRFLKELHYQGEGWGLASASSGMVMSDGTGSLKFIDPVFRVSRKLPVTINRMPTSRLNDLAWVGDSIFANVLWSSDILEISARDGRVTRIIDCTALTTIVAPSNVDHTLNGIAYNPDNDSFFLTGKRWTTMFEVRFARDLASGN